MIQEAIGTLESNRHQPAPQARLALAQQRLESDEAAGLVPGDGELQAGLERGVLIADVVAPVAIGFFHAQAVHGVVAGQAQPERAAGADDHVVHRLRELGRNVQLVTQLADVSDAAGAYTCVTEVDDLRGAEGERGSRQIRVGERARAARGCAAP